MRITKPLIFSITLLTAVKLVSAQTKKYTVADAHSHNDYKNNISFYRAYEKGFGSIEADVYAVNGQLMVAHEEKEITPSRSLKILYIDPLVEKLRQDTARRLRLLIEIKADYKETLPLVEKELKPLAKYLNYEGHPGRLSIVMTGAVPPAAVMSDYPDWIMFDADHLNGFTKSQLKKIGLVSLPFTNYSRWNGKGVLMPAEVNRLKDAIDSAHAMGKKIRFWGDPDTKSCWLALTRLGADVIGTDHIEELGDFFNTKAKSEYLATENYEVYHPTYRTDGTVKKVKNIILCIGDGMGIAQIYSAYTANRGQLNIFEMLNIGFSVTNSADSYVTDSAAGGTAFATGEKTNNKEVGVDPSGKPLKSFAEYCAAAGKKTADIVVCELTDATPAVFYAHQPDRDKAAAVANDVSNTHIDILLGSGYKDFTHAINGETPLDKLSKRGYAVVRNFSDFMNSSAPKIIALMDDSVTRPKMQGRGNYLSDALGKVTTRFKSNPQGFFMMIEGSQIDHGGHANNLKQVITENTDFDQMVGKALRFADEDGETLVIVTADHETGGLTLLDGSIKNGYVWGNFSTNDHTGTPVPVFAYGPHATDFRGVYSNTEIFKKMMALIKK